MLWAFLYNHAFTPTFRIVPMHRIEKVPKILVSMRKQVIQLFSTNPSPKTGICFTAKIVETNKTSAQLGKRVLKRLKREANG